jgi:hypothetical protein
MYLDVLFGNLVTKLQQRYVNLHSVGHRILEVDNTLLQFEFDLLELPVHLVNVLTKPKFECYFLLIHYIKYLKQFIVVASRGT